MELQGDRLIPAPVDITWAALNDPDVLKACVAGCETLERTGDDAFSAVLKLKVGPVSARFKGNLKLTNVEAPNSYTINFDGQGGVAGFGKGSADVSLAPEGEQTRLSYTARAQIGGKMAQIGSRLIDAAAGKITQDFFKAFEARVQEDQTVAASGSTAPSSTAFTAESPAVAAPLAPQRSTAVAAIPNAAAAANGDVQKLWWLIGGLIALAAVFVAIR